MKEYLSDNNGLGDTVQICNQHQPLGKRAGIEGTYKAFINRSPCFSDVHG